MAKRLNQEVNLVISADTKQAQRELNNLFRSLDDIASGKTFSLGNMTKEMTEASQAASALKIHLQNAVNVNTGKIDFAKLDAGFKRSGVKLEEYVSKLVKMGPAGQQAVTQVASALSRSEIPLRRTNKLVTELWTTLKNTAKWQISSSVLHSFMGALQTAKGYAQDLNESLTNIRIVTGYSVEEMAKFAEEANKAARALSTTTTKYTDASLIYYQQGLASEEVQKRTDITIKMANAAKQSVEETSNQLTAIWNNFDDGTKSLEYYADVITALGAKTASSTKEISGGLEKFAAIGETIGLSYEYATAALATITSKTRQSEDVVGTALKTIFARIQGLNLGETLDDGTTLNKYSEALAKVGINIYDTTGELKAMDNILDEMAARWNYLSSAQQAALAQTVAGVRQYNQLISLMEGWNDGASDSMIANLATAREASGTLDEQAQIYAESWEAARDRVKAAAESIYSTLLDEDFFIGALNVFEGFLTGIDSAIDGLGGLKGVLLTLGAIATQVFNQQIAQGLRDVSYSLMTSAGLTIPNLTEKRAKQQDFVRSQLLNIPGNEDSHVGKAYDDQLKAEEELRQAMEKRTDLSEEEKQYFEEQLDLRKKITDEIVIQAQKLTEAENKRAENKQIAKGTVLSLFGGQSDIIAEYENQNKILQNSTEAITKLEERFELSGDSAKSFEKNLQDITNAIMQLGDKVEVSLTPEDIKKYFDNCDKESEEASQAVEEFIQKLYALQAAAKRGLTEGLSIDESVIKGQIEGTKEALIEQERLNRAKESGAEADEAFLKSLSNAKGQTLDLADGIVDSATAIMSFSQAAFAAKGAIDALNNTELSFGEKASRVFTSLISLSTSALFGLRSLSRVQEAYNKLKNKENGQDLKSILTKTLQTKAIELNTKAKKKNNKATTDGIKAGSADIASDNAETMQKNANTLAEAAKNYGKEILPYLGKAALIIAAIATVAATIGASVAIYKKVEKAAERADKHAKELAKSYEELKEKQEAFNSTISSYKDGIDGLDGLTKGTVEYSQALVEANEKAMELIKNNKELSYTIEDGLIKIDENSLEAVQRKQLEAVAQGQALAVLGNISAEKAALERDRIQLSRDIRDGWDWLRGFGVSNASALAGSLAGAAIGTVAGNPLLGAGIGAAAGGTAGWIGYGTAGFESNKETAVLAQIVQDYLETENKGIFADEDTFLKYLEKNNLALRDNSKEAKALRNSLIKNREAIEEYAKVSEQNRVNEQKQFETAYAQWNANNALYTESINSAALGILAFKDKQDTESDIKGALDQKTNKEIFEEYEEKILAPQGIRLTGSLNRKNVKAEKYNEETGQWEKLDDKYNIEDVINDLVNFDSMLQLSSAEFIQENEAALKGYTNVLTKATGLDIENVEEAKKLIDSIVVDYVDSGIVDLSEFNYEDVLKVFAGINDIADEKLGAALDDAKDSYEAQMAAIFKGKDFKNWYNELADEDKQLLWTVIDVDKQTSLENIQNALKMAQELANANEILIKFNAEKSAIAAFEEGNTEELLKILEENYGITAKEFYTNVLGKSSAEIVEYLEGLFDEKALANVIGTNSVEAARQVDEENQRSADKAQARADIANTKKKTFETARAQKKTELEKAKAAQEQDYEDLIAELEEKYPELTRNEIIGYGEKLKGSTETAVDIYGQIQGFWNQSNADILAIENEIAVLDKNIANAENNRKRNQDDADYYSANTNNEEEALASQYQNARAAEETVANLLSEASTLEDVFKIEKEYEEADFLQPEFQNKIIEIASDYEELSSQVEAYKQAITDGDIETQNAIEKTLANQINLLDRLKEEGFDLDLYETYASKVEELNGPLVYQTDVLQELTIAQMKMQRGMKSLASNWEKWNDIVKDAETNWQDYTDILPEVNETLADLLDIDVEEFENLSPEFVAKHWEEITNVFNDAEGAAESLRVALTKDMVWSLSFSKEGLKTEILNLIDELAVELPNLEIGATLNDSIYNSFNELLRAGELTVEQINKILSGIGFEPEIDYEPITLEQAQILGYKQVVTDQTSGISTPVSSLSSLEYDTQVWIPKINSNKTVYKGPPNTVSIKKPSSGGGGGGSKPAAKPKKSDTVERYKEVNDKLDNVSENLEKIDTATERIYGKSRLANMERANKLLERENELNKEKLQEAQDYLKIDQQALNAAAKKAGIAFEFNATGDIANYTEEMTKLFNEYDNLVDSANADGSVSEAEQEKLDAIQERIDAVKEAISQYDETKELIADLEKDILDTTNKIQDTNFKIIEEGLQIEVDFNEEQLKLIDFYLKLIENDIYKMAEGAELAVSKYSEYAQNIAEIETAMENLNAAFNNGDISQAAYTEGLQTIRDTAYDSIDDIIALKKEMEEYYGNTLDMAIEKISKYTSKMEHSNSVLQHYYDLLSLINAIPNYKAMDDLLRVQQDTAKAQVLAAKETRDMLMTQVEERRQAWEAATDGTAEKDALYENYQTALEASNKAQEEYLSLAKDWAESIKAVYENTMNELAANLEDALTGGTSMDQLATSMDRMVSLQEEYLTTTNKIYETNKLMRTAQQAIDKTSNTVAKNKLKNFINETQALQEQSQLSEYELEIQQAKYDLLLAEIALEEAQNAKSIVRWQQDSEGNFGYVYTADEEEVASAQDDVLAAQNDLYNIGLRGANDYTQKYQQTMSEMYNAITELNQRYLDGTFGSYEEFQKEVEATQQYYYDKLKQYQSLYGVAIEVDSRVMADAWSTNFQTMTNGTETWYQNISEYLSEAETALANYNAEMQEVSDTVGLDGEQLKDITVEVKDANKQLLDTLGGDDGVIAKLGEEASAVGKVTDAFNAQLDVINNLIDSTTKLIDNTLTLQEVEKNKVDSDNSNIETSQAETITANNSGDAGSGDTSGISWNRILEGFNNANSGRWGHGAQRRIDAKNAGYTDEEISLIQDLINYIWSGKSLNEARSLMGFDIGGYTGDWPGSAGKLALLHKRELVLEPGDTENFLAGISLLDKILQTIDLYSANAQFSGHLTAATTASRDQVLEQHISIEASFPGVTSHFEIEEAFSNLAIQASQYANKK